MTIEGFLITLRSIFGGAVLTAVAGLFGAWRQSRREHDRWVRQERLRVYLPVVAFLSDYDQALASATGRYQRIQDEIRTAPPDSDADVIVDSYGEEEDELAALQARATEILTPLKVLGPEAVQAAAAAWELAAYANEYGTPWLVGKAAGPMLAAMREALGVEVFAPHSTRTPGVV